MDERFTKEMRNAMDNEPNQAHTNPTEKTLYQEPHDDHWGTRSDRLFQCGEGRRKGIGVSVSGMVFVKPMKEWHRLAEREAQLEAKIADYRAERDALAVEMEKWVAREDDLETKIAALEREKAAYREVAIIQVGNLDYGFDDNQISEFVDAEATQIISKGGTE